MMWNEEEISWTACVNTNVKQHKNFDSSGELQGKKEKLLL